LADASASRLLGCQISDNPAVTPRDHDAPRGNRRLEPFVRQAHRQHAAAVRHVGVLQVENARQILFRCDCDLMAGKRHLPIKRC
jgi:hypothetical protein